MENKIYNDDVERILNNPERQKAIDSRYAKKEVLKMNKLLNTAGFYASIGAAFAVLQFIGWVAPRLSVSVCMICVMLSMFNVGRWFEHGKCRGWH